VSSGLTVLLTDYVLAVTAFWAAAQLAAASSRTGSWAQSLWAVAFSVGAIAALAGGTVQGLGLSLASFAGALLWQCALLGATLAAALLLAGAARHALRGGWLRLALGVLTAMAALELVVLSRSALVRDAVWAGAATVVLLLAFAVLHARRDRATPGSLVLASLLAGAGFAVQLLRPPIHPYFNHNDACHLLLTASVWPFYLAGLRLRN
jgi:hypothetical protein